MKILIIHNKFKVRGGEETYVSHLNTLLKSRKHTVHIYSKDSRTIPNKIDGKLKIGLQSLAGKQIESELNNVFRKFKPDIVHVNNIYPLITPKVYEVCARHNVPIVHSVLDHRLVCPKGSLFRQGKPCTLCVRKTIPYYSLIYKCYADSLIATGMLVATESTYRIKNYLQTINHFLFSSEFIRDFTLNNISIQKKQTSVLPYWTPSKLSTQARPCKFDYFIYVGRLSEEKGILHLLKIFKKLSHLHLIVIGAGPLDTAVRKLAISYDNIHILGLVSDTIKHTYMKYALATIIPSSPLYEVGPYTLIESYSCGTPVIGPRSGVFLERIIPEKTGFLYKPDDFDDLKMQIVQVSKCTQKQRSYFKTQSQNLHTTVHSKQRFYENLMHVYENIIQSKKT